MSLIGSRIKYKCCFSNERLERIVLDKVSLYSIFNECNEDHYVVASSKGEVEIIDIRVVDEIMYNTKK